jgi:hypothetical protein
VPYQLNTYSVWQQLTSHVSAQTIARIAPAQVLSSIAGQSRHSHASPEFSITTEDLEVLDLTGFDMTCCEPTVMQGSTSIMAEADPAVLRQPTAAEQRLDSSLKEQRSNGAGSSVAMPPVTQPALLIDCDVCHPDWTV